MVHCGNFRTPRRERLAADIVIMSILYESTGVIFVSGFLHLYRYCYISDNFVLQLLQSFARITSVALAIEWFVTSLSVAIDTRYQNMPVMAVWRRRWKKAHCGRDKRSRNSFVVEFKGNFISRC